MTRDHGTAPRARRAARAVLASLALLAAVLALAYALRGVLIVPLVAAALERGVERATGAKVVVGAIDGSLVGGIRIRDVRTVSPGTTGPLARLEIDQVRASWSLPALLRGIDAFVAGARVEVDGARVALSLAPRRRDGGTPGQGGSPGAAARLVLPSLQVKGVDVTAERPGLTVRVLGISAATRDATAGGAREVALGAVSIAFEAPGFVAGPAAPAATLRSRASGFEADLALPGRGVEGTVSFAGGRVEASVELDGVDLGAGEGLLRLPEGTVSGILSGRASLAAGGGGRLFGSASLHLADARVRGVPLERLELDAALEEGALHVASLEAASGTNLVRIRETSLPLDALRGGNAEAALRAAAGKFSAHLADLPALLALTGRPLPLHGATPSHLLELEGRIGNGIVELEQGRLALGRGRVRAERLRAQLPAPGDPWSAARIEGELEIELPDLALLNRLLPLPALAGALAARVALAGEAESLAGTLRADARRLAVGGRALGDLELVARAGGGRLLVERARLVHGGGVNRLRVADLTLPAGNLDARRWRALLRAASGSFAAELGDLPGLLALAGRPLPVGDAPIPRHLLRLSGKLDGGSVALDTAELVIGAGSVGVTGARAALPPEGASWGRTTFDLAVVADLPDVAPLARLLDVPVHGGSVRASGAAHGSLGNPEGFFTLAADELFIGSAGPLRVRAAGGFSAGDVAFERLVVEAPQGRIEAAGRLEREAEEGGRLQLEALTVVRGAAAARLVAPALLRYSPAAGFSTDGVRFEGPAGSLSLKGRFFPGGVTALSFAVSGLGTDGWLRGLAGGRLSVRGLQVSGEIHGTRERPSVRLEGKVAALEDAVAPVALGGRFDLSYAPGVVTVTAFEWSGSEGLRARVSGRLPLDLLAERMLLPGALELDGSLNVGDLRAVGFLFPEGVAVRGSLGADFTLRGSWEVPLGEIAATLSEGRISGYAPLEGRAPLSATLEVTARRAALELRRLRLESAELEAEASGSWTGLAAPDELLHGLKPIRGGTLSLRGSFSVPDLSLLRAFAGGLRRLAGRIEGKFAVEGPASAPGVDAAVRLDEGAIDFGGGVPPLERIALEVAIAGSEARIERAVGDAGGAPFRLGGSIAWDDGATRLDLGLEGENVLLYRDGRVTARADLDVRARGPLARLRLEGAARLRNSSYTRTITLAELIGVGRRRRPPSAPGPLFSLQKVPWRDLQFDLRIGTATPVALRTNLARGEVRPDLTLVGTGLLPVLSGDVFVDPTRVSLPAGTLAFERGIVSFPPPGAGQPSLDLVGRTRLLGYDVTVQAGGTLRSPEVTLSSIPPLPDDELLLLVLAGTPPGTADAQAMKRILEANLARFVAEGVIGAVTGAGPGGGELGERIEVEVGRNVTRSGTATIETRFRVAGGDEPTGGALYLTGGTDVFDAYTMGVTVVFRFR